MNPVLLRKQLQDNASDLQDFCKDLQNWGEEMKRKEESLGKGDNENTSNCKSKVRKITKSEKKLSGKDPKLKMPAAKIGATDYAAWAKFDADAECQKLEEDIEDSELTDECSDDMQDQALIEKEKGNKFVKNQQWDEAIKCYSKAIEFYSYDPIYYANRALCYLKKGCFHDAELDCNLSLKLDNTYVKAYQRRAAAREGLNKLEQAEYDLTKVLELEPKNSESKASLDKLRKKLGKIEKPSDQRPVSKFTASRNKSSFSSIPTPNISPIISSTSSNHQFGDSNKNFDTSKPVQAWAEEDIITVKAIKKPPHLRSQKPLKRIKIVEKDSTTTNTKITELESKSEEPGATKSRSTTTNTNIIELESKPEEPEAIKSHVLEKTEPKKAEEPPKVVSAFKKKQQEKSLEKMEHSTAWPRPDQHACCLKSDEFKIIEKVNVESNKSLNISKEVKNTSNINLSSSENKRNGNIHEGNSEWVAPKNAVQFYSAWKNLKNTEDRYKYLKIIQPRDLPKIFRDFLESNVFSNILEVLVKHFIENKDGVFDYLEYFTQVKRFATFTMFMTPSDKNNLWKLFDYIKECEQKNKEDVDRLIEKYEL